MTKKFLLVTFLPLITLILASSWLLTTESGLHWIFQRASNSLAGEISVSSLSGNLAGSINIEHLNISHQHNQYSIKTAEVEWDVWQIFTGHLHIKRLILDDFLIIIEDDSSETNTENRTLILPDIQLPVRLILEHIQVKKLRYQKNDTLFTLDEISSQLTLLLSQLNIESLQLKQPNALFDLHGKVNLKRDYKHNFKFNWSLIHQQENYAGQGSLKGSIKSTHLKHSTSGIVNSNLDLKAEQLLTKFNWSGNAAINQLRSSTFIDNYPEITTTLLLNATGNLQQASIKGQLSGNSHKLGQISAGFDSVLSADKLMLNYFNLKTTKLNTRLNIHGVIEEPARLGLINLVSEWSNLHLPIDNKLAINSTTGKLELQGTLDDYRFNIASQLTTHWEARNINSQFQARGSGNSQSLNVDVLEINALDGNTTIKGNIDWRKHIKWQATLNSKRLNPGSLYRSWPGQINSKIQFNGQFRNQRLEHQIDIKKLDGELRQRPIDLSGAINWNHLVQLKDLKLNINQSIATVDGQLDLSHSNNNLTWSIQSPSLSDFYPDLSGEIQTHGTVSGAITAPKLDAELTAHHISYQQLAIKSLAAKINLDFNNTNNKQSHLLINDLQLDKQTIDTLKIQLFQNRLFIESHLAELTAESELIIEQSSKGWTGKVLTLDLKSMQFDHWKLESAVPYQTDANSFHLEKACLNGSSQQRLCLRLNYENAHWEANLTGSDLPLNVISMFIPIDLDINGLANLNANMRFASINELSGYIDLNLLPGSIIFPLPDDKEYQWVYQTGKFKTKIDKNGIKSTLSLKLLNNDQLLADINLNNVEIPLKPTQALDGELKFILTDFTPIELLIPEVRKVTGNIDSNVRIDGTLASPRINGYLNLRNGELTIPALGTKLESVQINTRDIKGEKIKLDLSANSGHGQINISSVSELSSQTGWLTQVKMNGKDFELIAIPDAKVNIDPDINITIQNRNIHIDGSMHIPYAKLQPKDISTAERVSDDAVIIGQQKAIEKWQVSSHIRLSLGDRVSLYGYGFEGRLEGDLLLEDSSGQPPRGTGEINIPEGRYRAYGQRLDIEQGRLLFTGGPLINPGLDFRAVRKVNQVTSGLKVRGNLQSPKLELYSEPVMGQTNVLSYLLLGRPVESTSSDEGNMMAKAALAMGLSGGDKIARNLGDRFGLDDFRIDSNENGDQASLVIGRYLSPKLYISYGVGLLEPINSFFVRYKISDQWQIKAESGNNQGADLHYTFER